MPNSLNLVSVGPGDQAHISPAAEVAIKGSEVVVAYDLYLKWIQPWLAGKRVITMPLTQERERVQAAINSARQGQNVSLISSGDIGVYGLAPLVFEELEEIEPFDVRVIPGVTAATASASLLGSPLSHDFVVLSLSDLLCPWDWIEARAEAAAKADLCLALYNVQSKKRQDGIYRILSLLLRYKSGGTICGVVRNAYREEQSITVVTLAELVQMSFDMFTCIVVGNRFTRRKGGYMYTPRGYNSWSTSEDPSPVRSLPEKAVWVFSGTSDGNELAQTIAASGQEVVVSVATEYGAETASLACPGAFVVHGSLGSSKREELLSRCSASAVVDATHPYAEKITEQLLSIAQSLNIPYVRYERPETSFVAHAQTHFADSIEEAAETAASLGTRIFLSTGSKDLSCYLSRLGPNAQPFVRVSADPDFLRRALELGIPRDRICAMQGPFSSELNEALWRNWGIDVVVTKDSGTAGGVEQKLSAARKLDIPIVVLRRPLAKGAAVNTFEEVLAVIKERICV